MVPTIYDKQPGVTATGITGVLTLTKAGTTARTVTFPDAAIVVSGSASALTSGLIPQAGAGGILADSALATTGITGTLTITKTGTTARTATFPDAAITVAGSASALTSGRVPFVTTGGLLTDSASLAFASTTLTVGAGTGSPAIAVDGQSGGNRDILFRTATLNRWVLRTDSTAESGTNAGSPIALRAYDDAGSLIDTPLIIVRAAGGAITLSRPVTCTGTITAPNGTAAAPGIRTTTYAHGLYSYDATNIGVSVAGVLALRISSAGTLYTEKFSLTGTATSGAQIFHGMTTSGGENLNLQYQEGVVGSLPADIWALRLGGSAARAIHVTSFDSSSLFSISATGVVNIPNTTASTSTATGALVVAGGGGFGGRVSATEFASGTTKVVGAQGAAVADATGAGDVVAQLNALLARLRTHGLIAT